MSTFREVVYMILDNNKLSNDDSYIEPEHVLYLVSKLRAYLLTSKYQQMKSQISNSNFQTLKLELEPVQQFCGCKSDMYMVKSKHKVPNLLVLNNYEGITTVSPADTFGCNFPFYYVNSVRFGVVGHNKWLKHQNYVTIGPDNYLYIKSSNSDILDLESIQITSVFEDAEKAAEFIVSQGTDGCETDTPCDVLDTQFPLEEGLIGLLLDNATNAVYGILSKSKDDKNSSSDETNNIMQYINTMLKDRYRQNTSQNE